MSAAAALALITTVAGLGLWQHRLGKTMRVAERNDESLIKRLQDAHLIRLDQAIAENPDDHQVYADRGEFFVERQRWKEAVEDLDQALARRPEYARGYVLRGDAHASLGDPEKAVHDYTRAIELVVENPSSSSVNSSALWYGWGRAHRGLAQPERTDAALDAMLRLVQRTPRPEALYGLGCVLAEGSAGQARPEQALVLADLLRERGWKNDPTAHYWVRAVAHYRRKQFGESFEAVMERIETRPNGPTALHWLLLAMIYHELGEPEDARAYLRKGIQYAKDAPPITRHGLAIQQAFRAEAESLVGRP